MRFNEKARIASTKSNPTNILLIMSNCFPNFLYRKMGIIMNPIDNPKKIIASLIKFIFFPHFGNTSKYIAINIHPNRVAKIVQITNTKLSLSRSNQRQNPLYKNPKIAKDPMTNPITTIRSIITFIFFSFFGCFFPYIYNIRRKSSFSKILGFFRNESQTT